MVFTNFVSISQLKQRTVLIILAVIASIFLLTLVYAIIQWRNDWNLAHKEIVSDTHSIVTNEPNNLIASLPNAHIFGKAVNKVGEVPTSNLQLLVTGIVKTERGDDALSKAYISIAGQPSKIYRTGDDLPYGVKVYAIIKDAVIVENNGRLEKILLPRETLKFKARAKEDYDV